MTSLFAEYATRKGVSTWPKGARWPAEIEGETQTDRDMTNRDEGDSFEESANRRLAHDQESQVREQTKKRTEQEGRTIPPADENTQAEVHSTTTSGVQEGDGSTLG